MHLFLQNFNKNRVPPSFAPTIGVGDPCLGNSGSALEVTSSQVLKVQSGYTTSVDLMIPKLLFNKEANFPFFINELRRIFHLLPPATKLGHGYIFKRVCDSIHRGRGLLHCMLGYTTTTPPSRNRPPRDQAPPPRADTPPVQCMLGDTGNKRAVSILLECNLVKSRFWEDLDEHLFILNSVINNKSIIIYDNNVLIELIVF